jgi:hypothetical protein
MKDRVTISTLLLQSPPTPRDYLASGDFFGLKPICVEIFLIHQLKLEATDEDQPEAIDVLLGQGSIFTQCL